MSLQISMVATMPLCLPSREHQLDQGKAAVSVISNRLDIFGQLTLPCHTIVGIEHQQVGHLQNGLVHVYRDKGGAGMQQTFSIGKSQPAWLPQMYCFQTFEIANQYH